MVDEGGFHLGTAEYIYLLVIIKTMEIPAPCYDQIEFACQFRKKLHRTYPFLVGVMAFLSKQTHVCQLF